MYTVELIRSVCGLLVAKGMTQFAIVGKILALNGCFAFAVMIVHHVFRLNHTGIVCAGPWSMVYRRGSYLMGLLILFWVGLLLCVLGCVVAIIMGAKAGSQ